MGRYRRYADCHGVRHGGQRAERPTSQPRDGPSREHRTVRWAAGSSHVCALSGLSSLDTVTREPLLRRVGP
jgi:hypothetical protein